VTSCGSLGARVPHRGEILVDGRHFLFFLSSNGVESTPDLANRSSLVRIRKRQDYRFRSFPEGDLLAHVSCNQPRFLGAVFSVIKAWVTAGKPSTYTTGHDFREWAGILDWIAQNVLHEAPLLEAHRQAQERVSNPAMVWLRAVALAVKDQGRLGYTLQATAIAELCEEAGIEIPGLKAEEEGARPKRVGVLLGRVFGSNDHIRIDELQVTRTEEESYDPTYQGTRTVRRYQVERFPIDPATEPNRGGDPDFRTGRAGPTNNKEMQHFSENTHSSADSADSAQTGIPPSPALADQPGTRGTSLDEWEDDLP